MSERIIIPTPENKEGISPLQKLKKLFDALPSHAKHTTVQFKLNNGSYDTTAYDPQFTLKDNQIVYCSLKVAIDNGPKDEGTILIAYTTTDGIHFTREGGTKIEQFIFPEAE